MFCEESLGKIKFGVFPKCVSPHILSLEIIDYFQLEQVNTTEWSEKKLRILISKIVMVGCCKLSLCANGLVMSMQFIFGDD